MRQRNNRTWVRVAVSLLLVLVMVCTGVVAAFAATPERLTAEEKATEQLVADALAMNRSTVDAMKKEHTYKAFLDTVAARQQTWVRAEVTRLTKVLRGMGVSPQSTVKDLKNSEDPAARKLYGDIFRWLVDETEDSSVLAYSQFTSATAIEGLDLSQLIGWSALQDFVDTIVPELLRYALEALRQLGFEFPNDPLWPTLDQKAIVDYAHKYAKKYNPAYRVPTSGSDCTNFVSQALYAGGLSMTPSSIRGTNPGTKTTTEEWYYYNSPSATALRVRGGGVHLRGPGRGPVHVPCASLQHGHVDERRHGAAQPESGLRHPGRAHARSVRALVDRDGKEREVVLHGPHQRPERPGHEALLQCL